MKKSVHISWDNMLFHVLNTIFLLVMIAGIVLPLMHVVSKSLSSVSANSLGKVLLLPVEPTLDAYKRILNTKSVITGMANSLYYTVVGTLVNVFVTIICAYPLSRKNLPGKKFLMWIFTFTIMFSGGLIPTYLTVKGYGFVDSRWALIIPSALNVWNMIIARTFFINTIPDELIEAGEIDGASDFQVFIRIVLPNSITIIAVMSLYYAVGHWNQYFDAMIYLSKPQLYNIQLVLRNVISSIQAMLADSNSVTEAQRAADLADVLQYAVIVFASLPIMAVYPFVQRYFMKGVMVGSLKG